MVNVIGHNCSKDIDFIGLGNNIAERREELNYNQSELSELLGVSMTTISQWENAKKKPSLENLLRLCNALECDIGYLLGSADYSTKEVETVCNYTGLTEAAAKKLHELNDHFVFKTVPKMISNLLSNYYQFFSHLIIELFIYLSFRVEERSLKPVRNKDNWDEIERIATQKKTIKDSASIALMNCIHEIESMQEIACKDSMIEEQIELRHSIKN